MVTELVIIISSQETKKIFATLSSLGLNNLIVTTIGQTVHTTVQKQIHSVQAEKMEVARTVLHTGILSVINNIKIRPVVKTVKVN